MARISKPPEVRRQEILDTAMELFAEKGYEDTSMADIARRIEGVVQGLCCRCFDSKRVLFREAMEQYVRECCARQGCPSSATGPHDPAAAGRHRRR
ncbi:MAG: TetR/AcrR family transcriptional regulator [Flavonifractor plautii]